MPYEPPKVWTHDAESGGTFASINKPTAGAQFDRELPRGEHPYQLHSLATPNGQKVTILFEELIEAGHPIEYDAWPIDISEGEQFGSGFVALNVNSKIPALLDATTGEDVRVFESGAIMLHLAERYDAFLGESRTEMLSWLFWQMGSAPFLGGGFGHFYAYAPEKLEYPINRYAMEAKRQLDVLDKRLGVSEWLAGDDYTIADMANWAWYGQLCLGRLYSAAEFLQVHTYGNVVRWAEAIDARPAVRRGRMVNKLSGEDESMKMRERHSRADFDGR
ncbi:glutathione-dependent disulfide-bond oxidoreductase [Jannaschia sp. W003]|uniref:glutathione-dependent disulfide-bond oxidoreductase n=1 Tax=Jannaschia sp. W003 TaxID=2867012 RepID=UPI0021A5B0E5|nr:glutathione-dependent disulfide-bond oxidoreductase [Jannaschia sp. W003]UWQ22710.1 glutathione-dependent disulfide-bond oxidoreductase [Jannaschia sp. W003]